MVKVWYKHFLKKKYSLNAWASAYAFVNSDPDLSNPHTIVFLNYVKNNPYFKNNEFTKLVEKYIKEERGVNV